MGNSFYSSTVFKVMPTIILKLRCLLLASLKLSTKVLAPKVKKGLLFSYYIIPKDLAKNIKLVKACGLYILNNYTNATKTINKRIYLRKKGNQDENKPESSF